MNNKKRIEPSFSNTAVDLTPQNHDNVKNKQGYQESVLNGRLSFIDTLKRNYIPIVIKLVNNIFNVVNRNKKVSAYILAIFVLLILFITLLNSPSNESSEEQNTANSEDQSINLQDNISAGLQSTSHTVAFPDNFSLMTTAYQGLVINWQGENSEETVLWDIRRATGNESCRYMQFNSQQNYQTLSVFNNEMKGYLAYFSPLDSERIIKSLARKNTFTLCGYEFSLKGSQALLGKHAFYNNFLTE